MQTMVDFRKLLIAQMIACNDGDIHSMPSVEGGSVPLTPDELAAYYDAYDDAERILDERGGAA